MSATIDRRRQPQNSIQAVKAALAQMDWRIREVTQQRFVSPTSKWANESFGYVLRVPNHLPVKELWVGFISHKKAPAGLYAGLNPDMTVDKFLTPRAIDYQMAAFGKYMLLKQIIPRDKINQLEKKYGLVDLKTQYRNILLKTYPFSVRCASPHGEKK